MNGNNIIALVITGTISIFLISFGILLLTGRGSFLIAGFNTMSKNEKKHMTKMRYVNLWVRFFYPSAFYFRE